MGASSGAASWASAGLAVSASGDCWRRASGRPRPAGGRHWDPTAGRRLARVARSLALRGDGQEPPRPHTLPTPSARAPSRGSLAPVAQPPESRRVSCVGARARGLSRLSSCGLSSCRTSAARRRGALVGSGTSCRPACMDE
jgi:hypothetical protein